MLADNWLRKKALTVHLPYPFASRQDRAHRRFRRDRQPRAAAGNSIEVILRQMPISRTKDRRDEMTLQAEVVGQVR